MELRGEGTGAHGRGQTRATGWHRRQALLFHGASSKRREGRGRAERGKRETEGGERGLKLCRVGEGEGWERELCLQVLDGCGWRGSGMCAGSRGRARRRWRSVAGARGQAAQARHGRQATATTAAPRGRARAKQRCAEDSKIAGGELDGDGGGERESERTRERDGARLGVDSRARA
uniref:Uncharacterized protein n=1 Tax=Oryza sativa subsp. japonica TaxID=39947 RepID=Q69RQ7_ORYSJ|nr:hypothetical protein [Oryza sativa Japonica Group]